MRWRMRSRELSIMLGILVLVFLLSGPVLSRLSMTSDPLQSYGSQQASLNACASEQLVNTSSSTDLLVVYGEVFRPNHLSHWEDGFDVRVRNLTTMYQVNAEIGATETGKYVAIFLDPPYLVASVGDSLSFVVEGADVVAPSYYVLGSSDIVSMRVKCDLVATGVVPVIPYTWGRLKALYR